MKAETYFVRWRGAVSGPYDISVLIGMLETGKITKHHQVSADQQSWMPIMKVLDATPAQSVAVKEEIVFPKTTPSSVEIAQNMPVNDSAEMEKLPGSEYLQPSLGLPHHGVRLARNDNEPDPLPSPVTQQKYIPPAFIIQNPNTLPTMRTSGLSVASLVMGILGVLGGWLCCGLIFPILAIVFGHIAYSQINHQPTVLTGKGMAITGFILGYVSLVLSIVVILAFGIFSAIMEQAIKYL